MWVLIANPQEDGRLLKKIRANIESVRDNGLMRIESGKELILTSREHKVREMSDIEDILFSTREEYIEPPQQEVVQNPYVSQMETAPVDIESRVDRDASKTKKGMELSDDDLKKLLHGNRMQ